ncbi:hypothetical protein GGI21_004031, partial [Coemansia aciculifera]
MNPIQRLALGAVSRRPRCIVAQNELLARRLVGIHKSFHTAPKLSRRDRDDEGEEPGSPSPHSASDAPKPADKKEDTVNTLDLGAIFDMLDLPKGRGGSSSQPSPLLNKASAEDKKQKEADYDEDSSLADLLSAIDNNPVSRDAMRRQSATTDNSMRQERRGGNKADPMAEFERILSDLAANDTEVYKRNRPAPRFWDETGDRDSGGGEGRRAKFIDDLNPESLFEPGPRASAFSAGSLTGDKRRISETAMRVLQLNAEAKRAQNSQPGAAGGRMKQQLQSRKEMDIEQAQLSRLSQCQSSAALSSFIYSQL